MTSATERLRALLDERGVRWSARTSCKTSWYSPVIHGPVAVGEWNDKLVLDTGYVDVTPEEAIAATLGPGTCEVVSSTLHEYEGGYAGSEWEHELSCGDTVWWGSGDTPEWCPWCGRKVVG